MVAKTQCGTPDNEPSPVSPNMGKKCLKKTRKIHAALEDFSLEHLSCHSGTGCLAARGLHGGTFFAAPGATSAALVVRFLEARPGRDDSPQNGDVAWLC